MAAPRPQNPVLQTSYRKLFENNRQWVKERLAQDPDYFEKLADGQSPRYLFIGCSDSRVPANEITGTQAGEMFVHRNVANLVVHTDMNVMAVLQYSVEVLKVEHVIVCGHYGCGGVKAAMDRYEHGLIDKWLRHIQDVRRLHHEELRQIPNDEQRLRRLVELNVVEQVFNLHKSSIIQNARRKTGQPEVHGWVYDIREGLLRDLEVNPERDFHDFLEVYRIPHFEEDGG